jgi:DNA-binding LacI/PurR family transcriptional regulator
MLDHNVTARMALRHLYDLGHRRIAFMKGQRYSLDSESRWQSIAAIAREIGIIVRPELCIFLEENLWSPPSATFPCAISFLHPRLHRPLLLQRHLRHRRHPRHSGRRPRMSARHSVIGFDDIIVAEYFNLRLTTVRQPLYKMGSAAAELLIKRIQSPDEPYPHDVCF